ncbi:MAG: O-methyltransferase [Bacilli bacterium]|nr:O-methyltransferase [Bacilli bacterium]
MYKDIIKQMEKYAEEENIPIMEKRGIDFLCKFIEKNNIKSILELGTAIGYSSIRMALVSDDIKITSVERNQDRYMMALKNIKACDLDKRITLICGDALDIDITEKYDLIFIDAAKAQNINFFNKYKNNLNKYGVIVTDNISFHGFVESKEEIENKNLRGLVMKIRDYIEFLKNHDEYETKFYKVGDGIAITYKKDEINE